MHGLSEEPLDGSIAIGSIEHEQHVGSITTGVAGGVGTVGGSGGSSSAGSSSGGSSRTRRSGLLTVMERPPGRPTNCVNN